MIELKEVNRKIGLAGLKTFPCHVGQLERQVSEKLSALSCLCPTLPLEDTFGLESYRGGISEGWIPGAFLSVPTVALSSCLLGTAAQGWDMILAQAPLGSLLPPG